MFLILTLIIIVASMNIISGLIIFVKDKSKDIGILKTVGLNNQSMIKIFMSIGIIIGSTSKIYAQKGTGGARHASRKAPIFVGGGVAHGPIGGGNYKIRKLNKKEVKQKQK